MNTDDSHFSLLKETLIELETQRHLEDSPKSIEEFFNNLLEKVQNCPLIRRLIIVLLVFVFLGAALYFLWGMLPRSYTLTLSGGDILSNRHLLANILKEEGKKNDLFLRIIPVSGSYAVLEALEKHELDVALIQGGINVPSENIRHIARVMPETFHILVRPEIKQINDLNGKVINTGSKRGGTRIITKQVLEFSGLIGGVDYAETAYSSEELTSLADIKMPDAIALISIVPAYLAEELIKKRGYTLLEIPFPKSLALRFGWVADADILAYTYNIDPAVPSEDLKSLGINLFLVGHKNVDEKAIVKLLETLFGLGVQSTLRQGLNPAELTISSGYPMSSGTEAYLSKNDASLFSEESINRLRSFAGLLVSLFSGIFMLSKFLRGEADLKKLAEGEFKKYIRCVVKTEHEFIRLQKEGKLSSEVKKEYSDKLAVFQSEVLWRFTHIKTIDHALLSAFDASIRIARARE